MRIIFEEYGDTILQVLGAIGIIGLLIDLISDGGALHGLIVQFLESAC